MLGPHHAPIDRTNPQATAARIERALREVVLPRARALAAATVPVARDLSRRAARAAMRGVRVAAPVCIDLGRRTAHATVRGSRLALAHRTESVAAFTAVLVGLAIGWFF